MGLSGKKLQRIVIGMAVAACTVPKLLAALNRTGQLTLLFDNLAEKLDRTRGWDRLPVWLSTLTLLGLRHILRRKNLYNTEPPQMPEATPPHPRYLTVRTVDGTYNDL